MARSGRTLPSRDWAPSRGLSQQYGAVPAGNVGKRREDAVAAYSERALARVWNYIASSRAAQTSIAENHAGLPL